MTERVAKVHRFEVSARNTPGVSGVHSFWANQIPPVFGRGADEANNKAQALLDSDNEAFYVYTEAEVKARFTATNAAVKSVSDALDTTKNNLRNELIEGLGKLTREVLQQEIAKAIEKAVIDELDKKLEALRQDLERQIKAIGNGPPG